MSGKRLKSDPFADPEAPPERDVAAIRQRTLSGAAPYDSERPDGAGGGSTTGTGSLDAFPDALARVPARAKEDSSLDLDAALDADLDADLDTSPADRDMAAIRRRALNLLARREHARAELERKLAAKGNPLDIIRKVLDRIQSQGLLSEERFAERYAASRKERGHGPMRILDELRERGIEDDPAEKAVNLRAKDWFELAALARRRHFGEERPDNYPEWARQARFLERRGFTRDHIRAALGASFDDI